MENTPQSGADRPNNLGRPRRIYNPARIKALYVRDTAKGAANRKLLKATLPLGTYDTFVRFLEVYAGGSITRGSGIGSPVVAVALNLFIAISTGRGMTKVEEELRQIIQDDDARNAIKENLEQLLEKI